MNMNNIFNKLKGIPKKVGIDRLIAYPVLLALLVFLFSKCGDTAEVASPIETDCAEYAVEYADQVLKEKIKELSTSTSRTLENNPEPTAVIYEEKTVYRDHTTFVKNWNELQEYKAKFKAEQERVAEVVEKLSLTKSQLESVIEDRGQFSFDFTEKETIPAEVITIRDEKTKEYDLRDTITSSGPLIKRSRNLDVYPKVITITKTEKEYLKKNNYLSIKGGALYLDDFNGFDINNVYFIPSIEYGHKWWNIEAGPVLDGQLKSVKLKGAEIKAGVVFKW